MYSSILVPVDLEHTGKLQKALKTAADLANLHHSKLHMVGVTPETPSPVAHNPAEYRSELERFAAEQSSSQGVNFIPHVILSHDPTTDLDSLLETAANDVGADLIVMASHVPGFAEYIFASRAGYLASHSKLSVFVVR